MNPLERKVSYFRNASAPEVTKLISIQDVLEMISRGANEAKVGSLRQALIAGNLEEAERLKQQLPGVTFSATFNSHRAAADISEYTCVVCLDFDQLQNNMLLAWSRVTQDKYVLAAFRSPSGNGIKALIHVASNAAQHKAIYSEASLYFTQMYGITPDEVCSDVTRLCFLSSDQDTYINSAAAKFYLVDTDRTQLLATCAAVEHLNMDAQRSERGEVDRKPSGKRQKRKRDGSEEEEKEIVEELEKFFRGSLPGYRFNSLMLRYELDGKPVDDAVANGLYLKCVQLGITKSRQMFDAYAGSDRIPSYNPLEEYLNGLVGRQRKDSIDDLVACMSFDEGTDVVLADLFIRKWLVGLVQSIKGHHNDLMLILCGSQNVGKTEFFRRLLPQALSDFVGQARFTDNKDFYLEMNRRLILIDDECASHSKKELEFIKQVISSDRHSIREAYAKTAKDYTRLASFAGTTNSDAFLRDTTGNRRFIPLEVVSINHDDFNRIDKDDILAEALEMYENGWRTTLTEHEVQQLAQESERYLNRSIEHELLELAFEPLSPDSKHEANTLMLTQSEILLQLKQIYEMNSLNPTSLRAALAAQGFKKSKQRHKFTKSINQYYFVRRRPGQNSNSAHFEAA